MAVRLSALRTRLTLLPRNIIIFMFLLLISVRGWVNPKEAEETQFPIFQNVAAFMEEKMAAVSQGVRNGEYRATWYLTSDANVHSVAKLRFHLQISVCFVIINWSSPRVEWAHTSLGTSLSVATVEEGLML
jgi:hypothetical protein